MNIYLLKLLDTDVPSHDIMRALVVRAKSEELARTLASAECGDEGRYVWTQPIRTSCTELASGVKGFYSLLCRDFKGG